MGEECCKSILLSAGWQASFHPKPGVITPFIALSKRNGRMEVLFPPQIPAYRLYCKCILIGWFEGIIHIEFHMDHQFVIIALNGQGRVCFVGEIFPFVDRRPIEAINNTCVGFIKLI
jgi:hypothetical protein